MTPARAQFIELETEDGLTLPGLLYEAKKSKMAAIYLHGNGSSSVFYNEKDHQPLVSRLNKQGISILYFNNRGAHLIKRLNVKTQDGIKRQNFGMAYEKIKDCIADIDGAISFLKQRGYTTFYLIGKSTGANKICVYNFYKPKNEISKYILHCGGDDTGTYYHALGEKKFWPLLKKAEEKIQHSKQDELMKELLPLGELFSYGSFYDIANPDGDYNTFPFFEAINEVKLSKQLLFRHFASIKKPALVIYGDQDEYAWGDVPRIVDILKNHRPKMSYQIIKGAGHSFQGYEEELAERINTYI